MTDPSPWETIPEVIGAARQRLSPHAWDYSAGGAETETTLRRNRDGLERLAFRPRVLRDVSHRDTSTTFLGVPLTVPVMVAPIGSIAQFDPDGALAAARGAHAAGTAAFVGSLSTPRLEDVRHGAPAAPLFLQVYYNGDRVWTGELIRRAEAAGYLGICLTVDSAVYGRRERDLINRFRPRDRSKPNVPDATDRDPAVGRPTRDMATWADVEWLRATTSLPLMLKGILGAQDALLAVDHGVDVVYVSNHGGRQMDHLPSTIEVLPEVVDAVAGRADVLVDSGFTRGTDVLKALALGARAVLIGKLTAWALAAGGPQALERTIDLLKLEMGTVMATLGVTSVEELSPDQLRAVEPPPTATDPGPRAW